MRKYFPTCTWYFMIARDEDSSSKKLAMMIKEILNFLLHINKGIGRERMFSLHFTFVYILFSLMQDGGLLTNSPCALAIHEAKLIWPSTPIQCVVSLGTGIYHSPSRRTNSTFSSLREKLLKVVASATDTEGTEGNIHVQNLFSTTCLQYCVFFCINIFIKYRHLPQKHKNVLS